MDKGRIEFDDPAFRPSKSVLRRMVVQYPEGTVQRLAKLTALFDAQKSEVTQLREALALAADLLDAVYDADDPAHARYAAWLQLPAVRGVRG